MFKRYLIAVALAFGLLGIVATSVEAQQIRPAAKPAAWMAANGWDGTKVPQADGRVRTDWFCGGNVQKDGSCKRGTVNAPAAVGVSSPAADAGVASPAPQASTPNFASVDADTKAYLDDQRRKDAAATANKPVISAPVAVKPAPMPAPVVVPVSAPQVQVPVAPVSMGGCWTKHGMSKTQLVELLRIGATSENWSANMCMMPEDFVNTFTRVHDLTPMRSVSAFADVLATLKEAPCTDDMLKNMVFVSTNGQKMGAAGKCQDDEILVLNLSNTPIWALKAGKPIVRKDVIIAKP